MKKQTEDAIAIYATAVLPVIAVIYFYIKYAQLKLNKGYPKAFKLQNNLYFFYYFKFIYMPVSTSYIGFSFTVTSFILSTL